jgi:hypothetical protein
MYPLSDRFNSRDAQFIHKNVRKWFISDEFSSSKSMMQNNGNARMCSNYKKRKKRLAKPGFHFSFFLCMFESI